MAAELGTVHAALTELYAPGNDLERAPDVLLAYFDDVAVVRLAKTFMARCYATGAESICAANALRLAQMAADSVGRGTLRRFDVDQATGEVHASNVTTFE
ncbi:hypothetical protein ACFUOZ_20325 [Paenarthrobacter sp. NPDC057355]|uniref:hypothetical protein n=1 Tax=Paenarthrobacter sp. NPDC057355 TaxID=3346105 RepID=UPI00362E7BD2